MKPVSSRRPPGRRSRGRRGEAACSLDAAFQIGETLDLPTLSRAFAISGRIQIPDFTGGTAAASLVDELATSDRWRHAISGEEKAFEIDAAEFQVMPAVSLRPILDALHGEATRSFRYQFDRIQVPDGPVEPAIVGSALGAFTRFMREAALPALRTITGCSGLCFADAQATRYRAGDFLTRHDDSLPGRKRRFAYVLGLSSDWRPEWGGLLQFHGESGILETMVPMYNSLCLFAVPQDHSVSFVAPYAGADRISVSGWLFDRGR